MPNDSMPQSQRLIRAYPWLAVLVVVVSSLLMLRQEMNYNQIYDEGAHIACGMEWLSLGTYTYETLHPPLARAATALPLFLTGLRSEGHHEMADEGTALLNAGGRYWHTLLLARLGVMPFFWLANGLIFYSMRRRFDDLVALIAVALFSFCPPVLAHSALATTDAPFLCLELLALLAFDRLLQKPSRANGALAGLAFALALMSKFTALPFFAVSAAIMLVSYKRNRRRVAPLFAPALLGCVVICMVIWATYRFSFQPFFTPANLYPVAAAKLAKMSAFKRSLFLTHRLPAVEFFRGLFWAFDTGARQKRDAFALGHLYSGGRWYFFPVAVLSKTPIALLLLAAVGAWHASKGERRWSPETALLVGGILGPMAIGMLGSINAGLRHVLPIYPFVAMLGAIGVRAVAEQASRVRMGAAGALVAWQVVACIVATPQFLPYFNEAAAPFFGYVLVDSDLDWGQDLYRLEDRLRGVDPATISFAYFGDGTIELRDAARWRVLKPGEPVTGWVAISESTFRRQGADFAWLHGRPFQRVGRSIRLYHL